jgi:hypothetical protein
LPLQIENIAIGKIEVFDIVAGACSEYEPVGTFIAEQEIVIFISVNYVVALTSDNSVLTTASKN